MAECLSCTEEGNVSPENVKRWTDNLSNVLLSPRARRRFKSHFAKRELDKVVSLVEFWEMCDGFLKKEDEHSQSHGPKKENLQQDTCFTKTGATDRGDQSENLLEEAEKIVQFAEDKIAFDAQMIRLKAAFKSRDAEKIVAVISEAKQSAAKMLEDKGYYKVFCEHLLEGKRN